jgi:hypothetical protein
VKYDELRSISHNIAASLADGAALLIGAYDLDVFGEASQSPEGFITVDFLSGSTSGGKPSKRLAKAVKSFREALPGLCEKHGATASAFAELTARYSSTPSGNRFTVTVADRAGRRTMTEYGGHDGQRVKVLDGEGRLRPKPVRRITESK